MRPISHTHRGVIFLVGFLANRGKFAQDGASKEVRLGPKFS